jgi:hypothetical protein
VSAIHVSEFHPADDLDGPDPGQGMAVALRFPYSPRLVSLVKDAIGTRRTRKSPRNGTWSPASRCWWVRSDLWPGVREWLLKQGVELCGPAAHPLRRPWMFGLEEQVQTWDAGKCEWVWPPDPPYRKRRRGS